LTTVTTIDFDAEFDAIVEREQKKYDRRLRPPVIRLWDGNWTLRGRVMHTYVGSFQELDGETGIGKIEMPHDYYLAKWVAGHDDREYKNVHITVDKDGVRWSGRMDSFELDKAADGKRIVRVLFKHDYEELKHILLWANPFLPAEVQFPRLWFLFGNAVSAMSMSLFANILRIEASLWMLPANPMDPAQWFNLDQSTWSMVVKPIPPGTDKSPLTVVHSRFKTAHEAFKRICADGQITPTFQRHLDGDDPPWDGADLRHGCLVIGFEDKGGYKQETSFGGNLFTGLVRAIQSISGDGMTTGIDIVSDPAFPDEYYEPGWHGTLPQAPGLIYRETEHSGIRTSNFKSSPAKDVQVVTGGHSMPGVNELISAVIQQTGDLIAAIIGVPPVGGAVDALLAPLYTDVFLAFMAWKNPFRAQSLGWSHYHEIWAEGADRAYTLAALLSLRTALWNTRETFVHRLTVGDGAPWMVGQRGYGQFYLGDRIGSAPWGVPNGRIFVDRVVDITLQWDRATAVTWNILIGQREQEDPVLKAFEMIKEVSSVAKDLGLV
jgi:hypothetical protein